MANYFKPTRHQDMSNVSAVNDVNPVVILRSHNLGAMTKQTSGKTGCKCNDNIEHFNIDPKSLIDDNARQHKKTKVTSVGTITKPDAINIGVSLKTRIEEVISKPSLCYPNVQNVQHIVDLQSKHGTHGTHKLQAQKGTQWR